MNYTPLSPHYNTMADDSSTEMEQWADDEGASSHEVLDQGKQYIYI